jgi:signal transduction histidine kinase
MSEEDRDPLLEAADRQTEHLEALIEQLLLVARLDADVEPLRLAPVDVGLLLRRAVEASSVHARGHTIDLRVEDSLPSVHTDELKVHQILSNLLDNALKYSPPRTSVTLRAQRDGQGVLVAVEDEGPGIPAKEQDRVFERFYQVDQSSTREVGGMGLGLYICRRMAQAIGATVRLERSGPEGSVFTVLVPLAPPRAAPEDGRGGRADVGEASGNGAPWPPLDVSPPNSA